MYTQILGQNIYYQKVGRGKNLVLLHGYNQDCSSFWNQVDLLKDHFSLWLLDLPGFGRSDPPKKDFFIKDYAIIVESFLNQQRIKKPTVLGHSLGGRVAIKLASLFPHKVDKLILEASAGLRSNHTLSRIIFYLIAKLIKFLVPNLFNLKNSLHYQFYQSIGSDYASTKKNMKRTFVNIIEEDLSPDMKKVVSPVLIIWGEKDDQIPVSFGKIIYRLIKDSKLLVFENIGHFPHLENPTLFAHYVKDFI